jgi:hypothetical protein
VPEGHSYEEVLEECATPLEGVTFTLGGPAAEISRDTDASGNVTWEEITPGPLFISETPPPGYSGVVVFCVVYPEGGSAVSYGLAPVEDFAIEYQVEAGYVLECHWFNYQEEHTGTPTPVTPTPTTGGGGGSGGSGGGGGSGGSGGGSGSGGQGGQPAGPTPDPDAPAKLIITNHTCPEDYDLYDSDSNPAQDCEELTDGIDFALNAEGEEEGLSRTTGGDDEGQVVFDELAPGAYLLAETLPENTRGAFISTCESDRRDFQEVNPFMPFAYAGPNGQIGVVLVAGETLACDWYNVPELSGTITITSYWCEGEAVIPSTCEVYPDGIAFTLLQLGEGDDLPLVTGEDGKATAEAEGSYELIEGAFEWCFAESDALDAEGNVTIGPGEQVSVDVYNCGPQPGS